jgi:hypothetical protein
VAACACSAMLEGLCGLLSDALRPLILVIHDVDTLCELVHILSTEILSETVRRAGTRRVRSLRWLGLCYCGSELTAAPSRCHSRPGGQCSRCHRDATCS